MSGLCNRLLEAKLPEASYVSMALNGEKVFVRRATTVQIRQWHVWAHQNGIGRKYEERLAELWDRFACDESGEKATANFEQLQQLVNKFGGFFLVEFERESRRFTGLFFTDAEFDQEKERSFMERSLAEARSNASHGTEATTGTAKPSSPSAIELPAEPGSPIPT